MMATFPANFFDIADSLCGQSLSKLSYLSSHFELHAVCQFENSTLASSARLINRVRLLRVVQKSRVAIATLGDRMTAPSGLSLESSEACATSTLGKFLVSSPGRGGTHPGGLPSHTSPGLRWCGLRLKNRFLLDISEETSATVRLRLCRTHDRHPGERYESPY